MPARIVSRLGTRYLLATEHGQASCVARKSLPPLAVGDWVEWQATAEGEGVIETLLPRNSVLTRPDPLTRFDKPVAANIDVMLIVVATEPGPDLDLVDEYLVMAQTLHIDVAVLHNKQDLPGFIDSFAKLQPYQNMGYPVFALSSRTGAGIPAIHTHMAGKTCVLLGQSGVGKSSIIAALLPEQEGIKTQSLDEKQEGKHTTSHSTLYTLKQGAAVIDSPGIREFGLWKLSFEAVHRGFVEIYRAAAGCKFHNCRHLKEPGCAVKQEVEQGKIDARRYRHYCQLAVD